jgi:hypothetical protein
MISPAAAFNKIDLPGTRTKDPIKGLLRNCQRQLLGMTRPEWLHNKCGQQGLTSDACGINCSEKTSKCYGWSHNINSQTPP